MGPSSQPNGSAGSPPPGSFEFRPKSKRFVNVPATIDIPVEGQEDEAVEIDLTTLANDDPAELCHLFEQEKAGRVIWMTVALAYAKQNHIDYAIEILIKGANSMQLNNPREKLSLVSCLCWMYLWKSREAPRVAPEGSLVSEAKTKEYYLQLATQSLNEASRINPAFPPLFLARGVLYLLRASLQAPSKAPGAGDTDKADLLRLALKSFDDAIRVSQGKNVLAVMGKARALFSLGKYPESLVCYQEALTRMPDMVDPDPRLGVGCCFWQLGYKEDAKLAWERCLEINPDSKIANVLLGLYHLDASSHVPTNSPEFIKLYKKAMTEYTQKAFKLDKNLPITCTTFANYFLSRKQFKTVDTLAQKAIHFTDVNAVASDGWYLLARKEHYDGDTERATDYYRRADDARGGNERGYLPAKFGVAQLSVLKSDLGEAKLRLEKMIQLSRSYEAMALLGTLYAEEVFANQYAAVKEDKSNETKKAIGLLESVRSAWKDPKKNLAPDAAVLLNLARLYESEHSDKALQCLQQVEKLELDQVPDSQRPVDATDEAQVRAVLRKSLPPQLLNNMGGFYFQDDKYELASEMFEAALSACVRIGQDDSGLDTDALVTTISFNLGRSYEARGLTDQAVEVYEGLLKRHDDYTDARTRLSYIKLRKAPNKEGPDAVAKLYQDNSADLEVRALYGWFLGKITAKKRPANVAEDPELRHYKHTLQNYEKHDRYALVGMGNLYLMSAREMRRESEADKQKRSATYSRAVEFFDKALQLDPMNAYAAQGIAIALIEDKKDYKNALQVLIKVRDTIKDAHVFVNLGHIYAELKQFSKAIESYETALSKEGKARDAGILSCLGRTWLNKARAERTLEAYRTALDYAKQVSQAEIARLLLLADANNPQALAVAPEQLHFKFNVAFSQIQLTTFINSLNETQRTAAQLQDAAEGLESAIKALDEIAASPQPPYPKHDIEQRANMARNTQRKQLERALASQREYEEKNKEKLAAALELRQAEQRRREEQRKKAEEAERLRQEQIRKEREAIIARDRELAEQREAEELARYEAELTTDTETGEKVRRKKKSGGGGARREGGEPRPKRSRKKKASNKDTDASDGASSEDEEAAEKAARPAKKRKRLTSRKKETSASTKYKSAEIVVDSSDEGETINAKAATATVGTDDELERSSDRGGRADDDDRMDVDGDEAGAGADDDEDDGEAVNTRRAANKRSRRGRVVESDDDDDEDGAPADTSMVDAAEEDEE